MNAVQLYDSTVQALNRSGPQILPVLLRALFAATLLGYFWASALTKLGPGLLGIFKPSFNAYTQIFPRQMEAVSYDASQLGWLHWAVVVAGTWAEFILPFLIVIGLATRVSALGMIGFVIVQTLTDLIGHGAARHPETLGAWFDKTPDALIADQRAFWVVLLTGLALFGAGRLSVDAALRAQVRSA
ncbi:DoxX family protein [Tropicibacter naphthalenivorans]|uniref:DoxX n=1 Tax=Tropicibacter naphthalenivorans TaxID=441103 RepID=A0A0N7LYX0_9RHOB|nr:DoxX family protein [Tropicibacter naphthalenivorans]CUH76041.1 DoxX [Tropicibacter naphthalenivorans]SMC40376.1 putative oxidoreductase [Tropicibacter naphthalenivorans]